MATRQAQSDACSLARSGNAERDALDDGAGTMEALYLGNDTDYWNLHRGFNQTKSWRGPYIMADLEAGM
jgi:hypothetical protein